MMLSTKNLTVKTDSYKLTHWMMNPQDVEIVYSYDEARIGAVYNKTVFFGLQYLLKEYLTRQITAQDIAEGKLLTKHHMGKEGHFNEEMWRYILAKYEGRMPLRIRAIPEGTPVDVSNALMTVENTGGKITAPLTNHFETLLSHVWAPSTVATLSYEVRKLCKYYLEETGGDMNHLNFMLHDFGFRGVNQCEAAGISGLAHLINFLGTDTIEALLYGINYYDANIETLGYSVPASEHSVMTARGEEGEELVFLNLLHRFPDGILSVVIDSYNYRRFIDVFARKYKDIIMRRNGKVVFRPDSGDPNSGTIDVLQLLDNIFGSATNSKGYLKLDPHVGALWGDGIDYHGTRSILFTMRSNRFASDNIVFGMGGGLLQKINRDVQRFAFKCCAQMRDGRWYDIWKKPLDSSKKSKYGRLALIKENGVYKTISIDAMQSNKKQTGDAAIYPANDCLRTVFENGFLYNPISFDQVRKNALE